MGQIQLFGVALHIGIGFFGYHLVTLIDMGVYTQCLRLPENLRNELRRYLMGV